MTTNKPNVELFEKIKEQIRKDPDHFLMLSYFDNPFYSFSSGFKKPDVACDTACCIAGWAIRLSKPFKTNEDIRQYLGKSSREPFILRIEASDLLGISEAESASLFDTPNWPLKERLEWDKLNDLFKLEEKNKEKIKEFKKRRAELACKVIDDFLFSLDT